MNIFEQLEKEKNIGFELNRTSSYLRVAVMKMLKDAKVEDITYEQFGILMILLKENGLYQRQIAHILSKDRPNITRMIDILEKKGFVVREKAPDNRRISKVCITEDGRAKVRQLKPYKESFKQKVENGISDEDFATCFKVLKQIRENLSDSCTLQI